ncbi:UDP-D-apiose/UDP-D-xylose synthase 2 [Olea europaea subsp. europaea]|uniref:UDP-D-apiose/UDP-D-xylose synthase 2 n=1 Tax=Olea europaea subsp. europaea TaxID=158383 RepID=A0A8S0PIX7_OLEEU|nr:UDP-D-apiose/UDP-D-xylose synthase 2 [Olea europaea subsp. europaea]
MFGTRLGRDGDAALFLGISTQFLGHGVQAMSWPRPSPGRIMAMVGMEPDFQAFLGNVRDASRPRQGCNQVISWTWCPSNFEDGLGLLQGFSLISRHFQGVSGTQCVDHVQDAAGTQLDLQAFLGHVRDASWPWQGWGLIFRQFCAVFGTRCAVHIQDATGMHPDFQDSVCRPCPRRVMAKVGTEPDFQAILGSFVEKVAGYVQDAAGTHPDFQAVCGHGVQAKLETHPSYGREAARFLGIYRQFLGIGVEAQSGTRHCHDKTKPAFQAFLGNFWVAMFGMFLDHVRDASRFSTEPRKHDVQDMLGTQARSQAFWAVFRTWYAGHIRDKSWSWQGCSLIFKLFFTVSEHYV